MSFSIRKIFGRNARRTAQELIDRGIAAESSGAAGEALRCYRDAVAADPQFAPAHLNLGIALQATDDLAGAITSYRQAVALDAGYAAARYNLGMALLARGDHLQAESALREALRLRPEFPEAWVGLAEALEALGRDADALSALDAAIAQRQHYVGAIFNASVLLRKMGRPGDAEARLRKVPEDHEEFPNTLGALAGVLRDQGRPAEAEAECRRALQFNPDSHEMHSNLGNALLDQGRSAEAEASFRRALELQPDFPEAHHNLCIALRLLGRLDEAVAVCRRALEINPGYHEAHSNLIFTLDLIESCSVEEHQAERRRWYQQHARTLPASIRTHANPPDPQRRLRVGYVSADFRKHSAYYAFSPVIMRHDRASFEVLCYSAVVREDAETARLRQAVDGWHSTLGMSDAVLAEQIRKDRIDILVDLSGHTAGHRLLAFARKPAPVQITAWGHATGTGLETMDYFLADPVLVPVEEREHYAEEVLDLPCCLCYEPPAYLPEVASLPALGGKPFSFGCVNRVEKITDRMMGLWARILAALPGAVLLVKGGSLDDPEQTRRFTRRLSAAGIEVGRVRLLGSTEHAEHLKAYGEVDLGLDPYPHGGGISTAEALCMGVPVVSLRGPTVASRVGAAILAALGMHDWIAKTDEDYVRIAIAAASDLQKLARTRAGLRARLSASDFGNAERYTRAVETLYRSAWRRWCEGQAPTGHT